MASKRYDKYKDSGVEWIAKIPEHWRLKKLKYATEVNSTSLTEKEADNLEIDYIDISSVNERGEIIELSFYEFEQAPSRARRIVLKGDTIVSTVRTYLKAIAFINYEKDNLICSTGFAVIRPSQILFPKYLYYLVRSEIIIDRITSLSKGVSYPSIDSEDIKGIEVWIPLTQEQTAIADFLDMKTAQIDTLIAKKQKLIELLKEERTAVINHAVTRGIDPKVKLKPSGVEWLGEIPEHWEMKKLKYMAEYIQTGSTPPSNNEEYYNNELDWFTPADFRDSLMLTDSKRKISNKAIMDGVAKIIPSNSVLLIGIGATLGKVGYILKPASANQQINAIAFNNEEIAVYHAYLLHVNQVNIVALSNAATLAILNQSQMKQILVPVPQNYKEVCKIVNFIKSKNEYFIETISKIEKEIELLQEYRTALISEVVTGKVKVV